MLYSRVFLDVQVSSIGYDDPTVRLSQCFTKYIESLLRVFIGEYNITVTKTVNIKPVNAQRFIAGGSRIPLSPLDENEVPVLVRTPCGGLRSEVPIARIEFNFAMEVNTLKLLVALFKTRFDWGWLIKTPEYVGEPLEKTGFRIVESRQIFTCNVQYQPYTF